MALKTPKNPLAAQPHLYLQIDRKDLTAHGSEEILASLTSAIKEEKAKPENANGIGLAIVCSDLRGVDEDHLNMLHGMVLSIRNELIKNGKENQLVLSDVPPYLQATLETKLKITGQMDNISFANSNFQSISR